MPQTVLVLAHLKSKGSITPREADKLYSITRLADVIFKLRKHHHIISTITNGKKQIRQTLPLCYLHTY